jgi:type VI secretion system FHA domain protein
LNLAPTDQPPPAKAPSARDLDRGLGLDAHFKPPAVLSPPSAPAPAPSPFADASLIPHDYDPLAPDEPSSIVARPVPPPSATPRPTAAPPPPPPPVAAPRVESPPPPRPAAPVPPAAPVAPVAPVARPADPTSSIDLGGVLEGAGLDPAGVTPELARTFGEILRVVVSGVMDVMRSRQQIKDEFRMQMTRFRVAENNPLKFSANVDDALHNLLVKRNPAYLGAVDAFEDAFDDLRNHQIAMLAGMRVAFEAMLAEFDPERLQQEFDRQKGLVPAKLRYWDLYRERLENLLKDREATFRRLFGEEFAQAYEEQLRQLKARASAGTPPSPRPPEE